MEKADFFKLLSAVPKSEIHLHAEGVISLKTVETFLSRSDPSDANRKKMDEIFSYKNLNEFVDSFLYVQNLFRELSDLKILFHDVSDYLKKYNIVYCELFFSPTLFLKKGFDFKTMIDLLCAEIDSLREKTGIKVKLIIDVSRTFGFNNALDNLQLVLKNRNPHVIGIGLGGDEVKGPAAKFSKIFQEAKKEDLHVVAHAGEDEGPKSVWDALNFLEAERIGHGISSIQDDALIAYLRENQVPLEICVTSNLFTRKYVSEIIDHPVKNFYEDKLLVTINTDDPTFFNTNLIEEYWKLHDSLGFSLDDILNLIVNGYKACFLPDDEKKVLIDAAIAVWTKTLKSLK